MTVLALPSQLRMSCLRYALVTLPLILLLAIPVDEAASADLTLHRDAGFIVPANVNGRPMRLRVDPGTSGYIILNPAAAARAGLKGSLIGSEARVGPIRVNGKSNRPKVSIAGVEARKRVVWTDRNIVEGADGLISPEVLPHETVTLEWREARTPGRQIDVPLAYDPGQGLFFPYRLGGDTIVVRFSTVNPTSMATASVGARMAAAHGGSWKGAPGREAVRFGIERPVRLMALQQPANFHGLTVDRFFVRTADNRGAYSLPSGLPADPDEVVVTARTKSKQPATMLLMLGLDRLSSCNSISYHKAARRLSFNC